MIASLESIEETIEHISAMRKEIESLTVKVTELEALSVTNIMIDVVPGDGSGQEVFASSVGDVEALLTRLSEKAEDYDLVTVPLRKQLTAEQSKVKVLTDALESIENWELPATGEFWDGDLSRPISFETNFGSQGAKAHIRNIASLALADVRRK